MGWQIEHLNDNMWTKILYNGDKEKINDTEVDDQQDGSTT